MHTEQPIHDPTHNLPPALAAAQSRDTATDTATTPMRTNLSPATWRTIRMQWLAGITPATLAHQHGCAPDTIRQRAKREQWLAQKALIPTPQKTATDPAHTKTPNPKYLEQDTKDSNSPETNCIKPPQGTKNDGDPPSIVTSSSVQPPSGIVVSGYDDASQSFAAVGPAAIPDPVDRAIAEETGRMIALALGILEAPKSWRELETAYSLHRKASGKDAKGGGGGGGRVTINLGSRATIREAHGRTVEAETSEE